MVDVAGGIQSYLLGSGACALPASDRGVTHEMARRIYYLVIAIAVVMLATGAWLALVWAPPDREMGDVQRIMYAHVPSVWMALLAVTLNFGFSIAYLIR